MKVKGRIQLRTDGHGWEEVIAVYRTYDAAEMALATRSIADARVGLAFGNWVIWAPTEQISGKKTLWMN